MRSTHLSIIGFTELSNDLKIGAIQCILDYLNLGAEILEEAPTNLRVFIDATAIDDVMFHITSGGGLPIFFYYNKPANGDPPFISKERGECAIDPVTFLNTINEYTLV